MKTLYLYIFEWKCAVWIVCIGEKRVNLFLSVKHNDIVVE